MRAMIILCVLLCPVTVFAELVEMKSGEVYSGEIVDKNDEYLTIKSGGAPMYLAVDQIASVKKEITAAPQATLTPGQIPKGASVSYVCQNFKCAFRIPEGFSILQDSADGIVLSNADNTVDIKVMPLMMEKPLNDENIGVLGAQMAASSLKIDAYDMESVGKIVKMFGERKVSGRKAAWFYYPELNNEYLMHRTFVSTAEGTGFMIEADVYPQQNDHYVEDGDKLANAFLDGFEIR